MCRVYIHGMEELILISVCITLSHACMYMTVWTSDHQIGTMQSVPLAAPYAVKNAYLIGTEIVFETDRCVQ